jgi:hypothetical protein
VPSEVLCNSTEFTDRDTETAREDTDELKRRESIAKTQLLCGDCGDENT